MRSSSMWPDSARAVPVTGEDVERPIIVVLADSNDEADCHLTVEMAQALVIELQRALVAALAAVGKIGTEGEESK